VQDALNDANDVSAPGPSGQNIAILQTYLRWHPQHHDLSN
jgi:hypothetical protein